MEKVAARASPAAARDAASGGNLLFFGPANPAKAIAQGDQLKIPAGSVAAAMR